MNYLTNYYKNLSEQLEQKVNILEARLNSIDNIRRNDGTKVAGMSLRADKRENMVSHLISIMRNPHNHRDMDIEAVERVLRDAVGVEGLESPSDGASTEDLKHVLAHVRSNAYLGSTDPQEQNLDAARQRTLERYGQRPVRPNPRKPTDAELARQHELEIDRQMHRDYEG
jgi:hypothetical protein